MMETVFYEDNAAHHNNYFGMNLNQLKRKMTLDLNAGGNGGLGGGGNGKQMTVIKKSRMASLNTPLLSGPAVLSSPDIHKLNMSSPEFEKFVIQQTSTLPTPTPNQSQIFFPKNVTEEQEQYVQGFTDALSKLQQQKNSETNNNNNNNSSNINNNNNSHHIIVTTSNNPITSNNNNNNNNIITINTSIATTAGLQQLQPQLQLVQTTTAPTTNNNSSNIQLLNNPQQQQQQIQLQVIHQQQPPPPPYTSYTEEDSSSDVSDSMSENSCSNSTTSSSTYTTNGHVAVPGSFHHRLPEYQMSMGATGTSGNIPISAAAIGSYSPNVQIKEEHGSSPPVSPIDMKSQEKIKLERKRQRNRVAASKCRKRKLERISKLEDKVKQLKGENTDLTNVLTKLRETVSTLKQQVIEHINSGCQITGLANQIVTSSSF